MRKTWIMMGCALLLCSCASQDPPPSPKPPAKSTLTVLTDANFEQEVLLSKEPVLVDFWAPWCGPCRIIGPVIEEMAGEFKGKLKVAKLNIDVATRTADRYDVRNIPTMILYKDGREHRRQEGFDPADPKGFLTAWLNEGLE